MKKIFNVGLIGCGHIAETYFRAHKYFNNFKIIKCADINTKAAEICAKTYKIESLSVKQILKDKNIDIRIFGKPETKPYRRMGVILASNLKKAKEALSKIKVVNV